jgi:hypothetical protein
MSETKSGTVSSRDDSKIQRCPSCGQVAPVVAPREGFYFRARTWIGMNARLRPQLPAKRASDFRRIAALGDVWGLRLDELRASYRMVRWAGAPKFIADREARYRALVKLLEEHAEARDLGKRFAELQESMPAVGRWAERRR